MKDLSFIMIFLCFIIVRLAEIRGDVKEMAFFSIIGIVFIVLFFIKLFKNKKNEN